ncbi:type VI secretion system baseplate subunit TssF [Puia dinghuensis]|uniref:Uncharacterized protein n=1 Tax=Puia dinghuensis TaxID=1792502 RepID=A0A8J2UDE2_9BACT|nr:type VI secretion system baseplate subunit TssF [Puia dinghuensis]GGB00705.1 hypothetical protein GCM10011511_24980 [Puia dinghuensis]
METKAHIKDRMLKAASAAWGYADKIKESDFDPLLSLLMEVYAAELEKISNEISMSRERVLQKMVQLMAPDVLTAPIPASAILSVQSMEEHLLLEQREQFVGTHPQDGAELWFSPAGNYGVTDTRVEYMAAGRRLFRYTAPGERETWSTLADPLFPNELWLGLTGDATALRGAQFYFDCSDAGAAVLYHHLPETKWYYGGEQLSTTAGFNQPNPFDNEMTGWLRAPHHIGAAITRMVRNIHRHRFLHITADTRLSKTDVVPPFAETPEKICWINISFPENIHGSLLANLHCQTNCFPVVNRQLHELTYRLKDWINIIPLRCEQGRQFFDLHSVIDQDRNPLLASGERGSGADAGDPKVILRRGGTGRFDERDARAVTEHLLQLLRDESAAFSFYNRDFITAEVKQVQQVINRLSQEMEKAIPTADPVPYLEVTTTSEIVNRHLVVEYWSTQGAKANGIRNGTPLMAYKNGGLRQGQIFLVTPTQGGRDRLAPHESIPAYKSAVLSKDRIMSTEDIRLFCIRELGAKARTVEVKKGVMIAQGRQAGYVKTIDVLIRLDNREFALLQQAGTLDHWKETLQSGLSERSMAFMPFRVFFEREEKINHVIA